ncbi:hypothetical protein K474DRAFT_449622 [Panus rudis PR-1116 ss-1]|nr:hypothetical protein K474DRAFT_449622 [Panus rudis PR-1116 ss-1]
MANVAPELGSGRSWLTSWGNESRFRGIEVANRFVFSFVQHSAMRTAKMTLNRYVSTYLSDFSLGICLEESVTFVGVCEPRWVEASDPTSIGTYTLHGGT